jgi:hypothetical protein
MIKCPVCQFDNEDGALFCDHCKSDLGTTEPSAEGAAAAGSATVWPAMPDHKASEETGAVNPCYPGVAEVATAPVAVAVAEAAVNEAVPVAQADAGLAAPAEASIAVAVPLPETPPITVAPEGPAPGAVPAAPTAPDSFSPVPAAQQEAVTPPTPAEPPARLPLGAKPKLVVLRGQRVNVEYPLYEGDNYLGRADEKAVDIDLEDQEPFDRIWSSRQHALITYADGLLTIEDLNSTNGTFVNRLRVHPGQKRPLLVDDVIQIGTVQLKVTI